MTSGHWPDETAGPEKWAEAPWPSEQSEDPSIAQGEHSERDLAGRRQAETERDGKKDAERAEAENARE